MILFVIIMINFTLFSCSFSCNFLLVLFFFSSYLFVCISSGDEWRSKYFSGGGGRPGHLMGLTRPRMGSVVSGHAAEMVTKIKMLKRLKVLGNESIFKNFNFSSQKSISYKKSFEKLNIFY